MRRTERVVVFLALLMGLSSKPVHAAQRPPVAGRNAGVSAGHPLTTAAAMEILQRGGNAFDAGVAALLVGGIVEQDLYGLGGEGLVLVYPIGEGKVTSIVGQGWAPKGATIEWYKEREKSLEGEGLDPAVVPGALHAALTVLERWGTMSFEEVAARAIEYAGEGFPLRPRTARTVERNLEFIREWPGNARFWLKADGSLYRPGETIAFPDLARTLSRMVEAEREAKSKGRVAGIVAARDRFYKADRSASTTSTPARSKTKSSASTAWLSSRSPGPATRSVPPTRPFSESTVFEIFDAEEGSLLYSRGFGSIYGEWETTAEARERHRTFHKSLRFPAREPLGPMRAVLHKRDATNAFHPVWEVAIDPHEIFVDTSQVGAERPGDLPLLEIERRGEPAHKVDLLLLGDGYTAAECGDEFTGDARAVTDALFAVEPFASHREDFNIWGLCPPSAQSGVSRPSTGIHRRTPVGATYDAFGSERYVLSFDNRAFRDVASWAPYDVVEILVNNETYGGGGIFGQYATVAAKNDWLSYVFIHEFAHHFAALADEYYTSAVAYEPPEEIVEPWQANVTANLDRTTAKWGALLSDGVPLPTPWPKEAFEANARAVQKRRGEIRAERRPEAEMSALFREQQAFEMELFGNAENYEEVGAFEGGNYLPNDVYRPQMDCIMFSRNPVPFCAVCRATLDRVIDLYTASGRAK